MSDVLHAFFSSFVPSLTWLIRLFVPKKLHRENFFFVETSTRHEKNVPNQEFSMCLVGCDVERVAQNLTGRERNRVEPGPRHPLST